MARDYPFCYTFTMAALTKACIAEQIQQNMGYSKKDASDFVNLIFRMIKNTLINGEMVKISGFGNFTVKQKEKRSGRNPQTGETMDITARRVITFKSSLVLKDDITSRYVHRLNEKGEEDKGIPVKEGSMQALQSFKGHHEL